MKTTKVNGETLVYIMRAKTRRLSIPFWTLAKKSVLGDSNFLPLCACLQITMKSLQVLIFGLQIHFSKKVNSQTWNPLIITMGEEIPLI